jgi:branched-chain amino acid aminotransferase
LAVPNELIIYSSHLNLNQKIYEGISAITVEAFRDNPHLKTTNYHACLNAWKLANDAGCFEAILMNKHGIIFEGSRSNIFWIKNKKLFTRADGVLPGITRQTILNLSPYPVEFGILHIENINEINECFLTNSGSGIIPVTQINGGNIGDGSVGTVTKQLLAQYNNWILQDITG